MTLIDLVLLGIVVGSNNLAVALTLGALGQAELRYRIMLVFGVFEFCVPLVGIRLGSATAKAIGSYANIMGAVMLFGLGLLSVIEGIRDRGNDDRLAQRVTRWRGLVVLAAGLSTDNMVVGFSLGLGKVDPLTVAGTIAFFAVLFTWLGIRLGRESRRRWERSAKIGAGALLMGFGVASGAGWF
ncbi:MAG TPA: manganese efflux pump [Desulfobacterales bacterium]|nr:manganese efflux pump [Desulfobacterales bacterium]